MVRQTPAHALQPPRAEGTNPCPPAGPRHTLPLASTWSMCRPVSAVSRPHQLSAATLQEVSPCPSAPRT